TIVRSVKVVNDRIYTGCYMEFGYWSKDDFGTLQYFSLSRRFKDDLLRDEEFWNILNIDDWIVFQSLNRIYIYNVNDGEVSIIDSETTIPKMYNVEGALYFQGIDRGVFKIENGQKTLVFENLNLRNDEIINIWEYENNLLFLTKHNGFYRQEGESIVPWNTTVDNLLKQISLYNGIRLNDGSFALGTISHGLILLDANGKEIYHINQVKGLRNNTVLSLLEDSDKNLWLGLDDGISYINLKSPFRVYHDGKGLVGSVYTSAIKDNILYLGTNQGLFYKELQTNADFVQVQGTHGQVWSLNIIGETLFCGHHTGTFVIDSGTAEKVADIPGTWKVGRLNGDANLLLQGNYDGLYVLQKTNSKWQLRNKINGFEHSSRYFEVFDESVFVNHEYKGVFRIEVDPTYYDAKHVTIDTLLKGSNSGMTIYNQKLLYAYKKGVLQYDGNKKEFVKDSILSSPYDQEEYLSGKLVLDNNTNLLWLFTNSNISYISGGTLTSSPKINSIPLTENMREGIVGYESATPLGDGNFLFGNRSGYITVAINDITEGDFTIGIKNIKRAGKNRIQKEDIFLNKEIEGDFKSNENSLELSFYSPVYNKFLKPQYQYLLEGVYPNWSSWSTQPSVIFENLPAGEYTFKVRSRAGTRLSSNIASYSFTIARPWYRTNAMLGLYLFLFILGSIVIHNAYKRYYHKRQKKLVERNKREMELEKAKNEKEIIRIKNEQLKEDFKNKSNELAASTMSIIKKNELLSNVKNQLLSSVDNKDTVKPIINIIDNSLKQNDDWELFKEAFNNADRKFLKKLKKFHPNLSPNDIRLCAYLRLNLSSKEIAPMFNISPRSVEIKRYRLRKKMNLSHDDNLVDYILKL
ncbi:MAG: triple tyrosine motif-containing protein, partial [Allomuricauda sp.]